MIFFNLQYHVDLCIKQLSITCRILFLVQIFLSEAKVKEVWNAVLSKKQTAALLYDK